MEKKLSNEEKNKIISEYLKNSPGRKHIADIMIGELRRRMGLLRVDSEKSLDEKLTGDNIDGSTECGK